MECALRAGGGGNLAEYTIGGSTVGAVNFRVYICE